MNYAKGCSIIKFLGNVKINLMQSLCKSLISVMQSFEKLLFLKCHLFAKLKHNVFLLC